MKNQPSRDIVHRAKQSLSRSIPLMFIALRFFNVQEKSKPSRQAVWDTDSSPRWLHHTPRSQQSRVCGTSILAPGAGSRFHILSQKGRFRGAQCETRGKSQCHGLKGICRSSALPCLPFRACRSVPCLGKSIYSLFPWLILSMADRSGQKPTLFPDWREVDVSRGPGEDTFQRLDWVELISF